MQHHNLLGPHDITRAKTQHTNVHVLQQTIVLDQFYQAKFEHIAGTVNIGADGLSWLCMQDLIPEALLKEIYAINELD